MIEHIEPKATADGVAVYCAHDKIVDTRQLGRQSEKSEQAP